MPLLRQFQAACESFVEIEGVVTNCRHFKVQRGQKQVPDIFRILQNR